MSDIVSSRATPRKSLSESCLRVRQSPGHPSNRMPIQLPETSGRRHLNPRRLAPKDIVGIDRLPSQSRNELRDLAAVIPRVAEHLGEHALDIPPIEVAVGD